MPRQSTRVQRVCEQCGKPMLVYPSRLRRGEGRFCSRSCTAKSLRENHGRAWKGGRVHTTAGYIAVYSPDHPAASPAGYVYEHRLVMERELGRLLLPTEVVHHLSGMKTDNRPWNLTVMTNSEHVRLHNGSHGWSRHYDACVACGTTDRPHQARGMCNRCYADWSRHRA